jgi:hypothetical protein
MRTWIIRLAGEGAGEEMEVLRGPSTRLLRLLAPDMPNGFLPPPLLAVAPPW